MNPIDSLKDSHLGSILDEIELIMGDDFIEADMDAYVQAYLDMQEDEECPTPTK